MPVQRTGRAIAMIAAMAGLVLGGCAHRPKSVPTATVTTETTPIDPGSYLAIVTAADADRLKRIDAAWAAGLAAAWTRHGTAIKAEGALLDPAAALPRPAPPPGTYRCRVVTLGTGAARFGKPFAAFKPFTCFVQVEDKLLIFMKATGSALPGGRLWDDGDKRLVFLGATADKPGAAAPAYGTDPRRDRAGVVERIGDFRWRMVTPWIPGGPTLEVMELVPDTPPPTPAAA